MRYSPARRQDRSSPRDTTLLLHHQQHAGHFHDAIPSLAKTSTGSSSTLNSNPNSSLSRSTPPRPSKTRSFQHSGSIPLNQSTLSADDTIFRGAEILRMQIMRGSFDEHDENQVHRMDSHVNVPNRHPSRSFSYDENDNALLHSSSHPLPPTIPSTSPSRRKPRHLNIFRNEEEVWQDRHPPREFQGQFENQSPHFQHSYHSRSQSMEEKDSISTDWSDPWPPPQPDISEDVIDMESLPASPPEPPGLSPPSSPPGIAPPLSWEDLEEHRTYLSFTQTGDAKNWSYISDDDEDDSKEANPGVALCEEDQISDDNTTVVLARAGEILNKASEDTGSPSRMPAEENPVLKHQALDLENDSALNSSILLGTHISSERSAERISAYPIPHRNLGRSASPSPPPSPFQTRARATTQAETGFYQSTMAADGSKPLPLLEAMHPNPFDLLKDLQQDEMSANRVGLASQLDVADPSPLDLLRDLQEDEGFFFPQGAFSSGVQSTAQPKPQFYSHKKILQDVTRREDALREQQQQDEQRRNLRIQEERKRRKQKKQEQKKEEKKRIHEAEKVAKGEQNFFKMPLSSTSIPKEIPSPCESIVRPSSSAYQQLMKDPGFRHAQRAGILWQSLVSQHVRFPSKWWNGSRSPPMGLGTRRLWSHLGRHRMRCCYDGNKNVHKNNVLGSLVSNRGSAGRLLLHVLIRDIITCEPILDIAVGAFHPNARGVRTTPVYDPNLEDYRDIWLALRPRGDDISPIESLLTHNIVKGAATDGSPLGPTKHEVHNGNMRAVFGERPPVQTVFVLESELYELFSEQLDGSAPPAAVLLAKYLPGFQTKPSI